MSEEYFKAELEGKGCMELLFKPFGDVKALGQEWNTYIQGFEPGG